MLHELSVFTTLAAEEGGSPISFAIAPYITAMIVFGIAFLILATKVWPKITAGLDEREQKILGEIKAAEEARAEAQASLEKGRAELDAARREATEMVARVKADAQKAGEELRRRNEEAVADMKRRATEEIESARREAVADLHREAARLSTQIAARILEREISADDQQRLIDESLAELGAGR